MRHLGVMEGRMRGELEVEGGKVAGRREGLQVIGLQYKTWSFVTKVLSVTSKA